MPFVLSENFITQLSNLRENYEKEAGVKLDRASQPYSISLFFGAKDVDSRKKQIVLMEQWVQVFCPDPSNPPLLDTKEALLEYITALRVLMAVGFFIKFQIDGTYSFGSGGSTLMERLIHQAMGVSRTNVLDEETWACCLLAAKRFLGTDGCFERVNARLKTPFTERQWVDFTEFVTTQCNLMDGKFKSYYPITTVMMSAVSRPLELVGSATGYLVANVLVKSTSFQPVRYALTAMIGSGVFLLTGPTTNVGVLVLVPAITGQAIDFLCGASLAWTMGTALRWVGQGVGMGVGVPLDVSKRLLYQTCSLFESTPEKDPTLRGMVLVDGHTVVDGEDFTMDDFEEISKESILKMG